MLDEETNENNNNDDDISIGEDHEDKNKNNKNNDTDVTTGEVDYNTVSEKSEEIGVLVKKFALTYKLTHKARAAKINSPPKGSKMGAKRMDAKMGELRDRSIS